MREHRRDNLRALLRELAQGGLTGIDAQASFLVTDGATLKNMLGRAVIGDRFASNAEWTMHRRDGWLDEDHQIDPF